MFDLVIRRVPRHHWVRLAATTRIEPGHGWLYGNLVRRDTATIRGIGLVLMRIPHRAYRPERTR